MRNNSFPLKGDCVVVSGAARGIGAATVKNLVEQGIFVIAADSNSALLSEMLQAIDPKSEMTVAVTADVTIEADCQRVAEVANAQGIRI